MLERVRSWARERGSGRGAGGAERQQQLRRERYLRQLREVQRRDLGGLVFDLRRFDRGGDDLVQAKVSQLDATDRELRALRQARGAHGSSDELREPGIGGACSVCLEIHPSDARFCARCGSPVAPLPRADAPQPR